MSARAGGARGPWTVVLVVMAALAALAVLLPATAAAAQTTAQITLKNPLVSPGIGIYGRYNIGISNIGAPGFPFLAGDKRAHCVEFTQGAATGQGQLRSGADIALGGDAAGAVGNARVKWLTLSSYYREVTPSAGLSVAQEMAAHQSAIWALTDPTAPLGDLANVRNPGDPAAFARAKELYPQAIANAAAADQAPSVTVGGGQLCVGAKRTVTLTGAPWTAVEVSVPAGSKIVVAGQDKGTATTVVLDADGTVDVEVQGGATTVTVTAKFKVPTMVQSRNGPNLTNQDFVYLEFQDVTKTAQITFIDCKPLAVAKTAAARSEVSWTIDKSAGTPSPIITTADQVTVTYTITVTKGPVTGFAVSGTITVTNPNPFAVSDVDITDAIQGGPACTVTGGLDNTVPAGAAIQRAYACTPAGGGPGTNVATVTWAAVADKGFAAGQATGSAPFAFGPPTHDQVVVSDTFPEFAAKYPLPARTITQTTVFTYDKVLAVPAAKCVTYTNTARFVATDDPAYTGEDTVVMQVCREGKDLVVTKTATPSFTRTFPWTITKTAAPGTQTVTTTTATVAYTVVVTKGAAQDSGWRVTGAITVVNPNPFAVEADVTDALPGAGCQVAGGQDATIPAAGQAVLDYVCTFGEEKPTYGQPITNTATATWDKEAYDTPSGAAQGTAQVTFTEPTTTVNDSVDVVDAFAGGPALPLDPPTISASQTYGYSRTIPLPVPGCSTVPNTASVLARAPATPAGVRAPAAAGDVIAQASASAQACRQENVNPPPPSGGGNPPPPPPTPPTPPPPLAPANLGVTKAAPATAVAGQVITYVITVRNTGTGAAKGVVLTDRVPRGASLAPGQKGVSLEAGRLRWPLGTLKAKGKATRRVALRLDTTLAGRICNTGVATATNAKAARDTACTKVVPIAKRVTPAVTG